jgi:hypothetical protein
MDGIKTLGFRALLRTLSRNRVLSKRFGLHRLCKVELTVKLSPYLDRGVEVSHSSASAYSGYVVAELSSGHDSWSLTLREERRLRVLENMVLRRIFGSKWDEATWEWRRLHNEELSDLYLSPNIIRVIKSSRMRWAGHVARMGEGRGAYRILVGRPEGRRPLGRPRRRWEDYIKTELQEVGWGGGMDWIDMAQDRDRWRAVVSAVMNLRVP